MKKILSIDGGGIRGIIPGQVLITLEKKLQIRTGNEKARLADFFDFFAGTSTGGILTCIYLCPSKEDINKARFTAEEAVDLYIKNGSKIFDLSIWQNFITAKGILDEKYKAHELEKLLERYFKNLRLSQLIKPCIIPSYDIHKRKAHFFTQHDHLKRGDGADFLIRDVCRSTSAAPTYFECALIESINGISYPLIDGGVFANNPTLCAYSEICGADGNLRAKDMFIVSIGTSSVNTQYDYITSKNWGAIGWIKPVIDIMMSGASETTHYHLTKMFNAIGKPEQYVRFQPTDLRNADTAMDNAQSLNIAALVEVGKETALDCDKELNRIVDILVSDGPDPVIFTKALY